MIKKFLLLLLSVVYLASSSGATLYIHQCMDKIVAWKVNVESENPCMNCGKHNEVPKDCCTDYVKIVKSTLVQNLPGDTYHKIEILPVTLPKAIFTNFNPLSLNVKHNSAERFIFPRSHLNYCAVLCTFLI